MIEHAVDNPYALAHPAGGASLFFGRESTFDWIARHLDPASPPLPLVLRGVACIGKTSVLRQIEAGRLGPGLLPLFIDLGSLAMDSLSIFMYDLAQTAVHALGVEAHDLPLAQTDFVASPYKAFQRQFLEPALSLAGQRLLFLFDHLDVLLEQVQAGKLPPDTFESLYGLIHSHDKAHTLFVLEYPKATLDPEQLIFLDNVPHREVGPLSAEAAMALIREPVSYTVVRDVAQYIYQLTSGHPYNIQQICRTLFQHQRERNLNQLTIADVVAVKKGMPQTSLETAAIHQAPVYHVKANPAQLKTIRQKRSTRKSQRGLLFFATALIFLLAAGVWLTAARPGWNFILSSRVVEDVTAPALTALDGNSEPNAMGLIAIAAATPTHTLTAVVVDTAVPIATTTATATPTDTPTATATPTHTATPTATPDSYPPLVTRRVDGMPMVLIPAGTFLMGAPERDVMAAPDERPQREVTLDQFYIDKYEVNVAQYAAFLNRLGNHAKACSNLDCALPRGVAGYTSYLQIVDMGDGSSQYSAIPGYANYPMNHVSWYGADAYCRFVNARLPTEAEWEYAARGSDGRLYPWGNAAPSPTRAVYQSESFDNLKPVDALPEGASPFGVYGMAGSVWEWVADWYDENYYRTAPSLNPEGPETGLTRVVRGGAWPNNNEADRIRAANRNALAPEFISSTVGFRCARGPGPPSP